MSEVSRALDAIDRGEPRAASELLPLVYDELRKLAAQKLAHERPGQTLDATALVHEAYMRLVGNSETGARAPATPFGPITDTSSRRHPKQCAASWLKRGAARDVANTAVDDSANSRILTRSPRVAIRTTSLRCTKPWNGSPCTTR